MIGGNNARRDGSSVTTLVGVSNVDFETVVPLVADPTTGRLLVDISGTIAGNTIGMEIPVGTVNGVNTVFTVTNLPIFIDASGQINVSSTQDASNYGFVVTGSSPSYTLTFTNAPTQTPHSFYNANTALSGQFIENEIVSGSGTSFTLAHTPITGSQAIYALGQRLVPTTDYTISGAVITTINSWLAGQLLADYQYNA